MRNIPHISNIYIYIHIYQLFTDIYSIHQTHLHTFCFFAKRYNTCNDATFLMRHPKCKNELYLEIDFPETSRISGCQIVELSILVSS